MATPTSHKWRFYRAGGVDQVRLETGADLVHLAELDQKLWVALSCPVKGLQFDERTLEILDLDHDGRVRAPEILEAVRFVGRVLKDPDTLVRSEDSVALANLDAATPEGKLVLGAAKHMLKSLGRESQTTFTIAETMQTAEVFAQGKHNGDGVVPPETVDDAAARKVAEELLDCVGGVTDKSGKPGFDLTRLGAFYGALSDFAAWSAKADADRANVLPLGDGTAAAVASLDAVKAKLDDYFLRSRLAAFDPRAQAAVNRSEEAYLEAAAKDLSVSAAEIVGFPVALVEAGKPLNLAGPINPAWSDAIATFQRLVVAPLLGKDKKALALDEWTALEAKFGAFRAWYAGRVGSAVEKLGLARVKAILGGKEKVALEAAIATDVSVAPEVEALGQVERLARIHRDLFRLVNNFVSFTDFYARKKAIFQAGTMFLDGRSCDLCIQVNDVAKHGTLAGMSKMYLAYADCSRPSGEKMTVATAITAGGADNLFVGRNGLFYDRKGRDWDATITKIVDNPISIRQAFWGPYKKVLRWIEDQVAKRAAAADDAANSHLQTAASHATEAGKPDAPAVKPKMDIGVVAALGVAVGGITAALTGLLAAFFGLGLWMPLGIVGLVLLISGPSMLIAFLKLRQRNLGPILDANGWAVNTLTKVNLPLGRSLTEVAALPPGAERSMTDPYAPKRSPWPKILFFLLLLGAAAFGLWKTGWLSKWVPQIPRPEKVWFDCDCAPDAGAGAHPKDKPGPAKPAGEPAKPTGDPAK